MKLTHRNHCLHHWLLVSCSPRSLNPICHSPCSSYLEIILIFQKLQSENTSHFTLSHKLFYSMVTCILPPVPGPKIKGFDTHLLEVSARGGEWIVTPQFIMITFSYAHTVPINLAWPALSSLPGCPSSLACEFTERCVRHEGIYYQTLNVREKREKAKETWKHIIMLARFTTSIYSTDTNTLYKDQFRKSVNINLIQKRDLPPPPLSPECLFLKAVVAEYPVTGFALSRVSVETGSVRWGLRSPGPI